VRPASADKALPGALPASLVLPAPGHTGKYRIHIQSNRMNMTGILIIKPAGDEWRGSMINEFGIKAFDFIVKKQRCKLLNTVSLLNKWYIRKIIANDLSFLFRATQRGEMVKGKSLTFQSDGMFRIRNERQHIEYIFQPLTE
jgi:hypothetical protein